MCLLRRHIDHLRYDARLGNVTQTIEHLRAPLALTLGWKYQGSFYIDADQTI